MHQIWRHYEIKELEVEGVVERFRLQTRETLPNEISKSYLAACLESTEAFKEALRKGEKVLIFCHFQDTAKILEAIIVHHFKVKASIFNGTTNQTDRARILKEMDDDKSGAHVAILSFPVGGAGLNFLNVNLTILFEEPPNPGDIIQAEDRSKRMATRTAYVKQIYSFWMGTCIERNKKNIWNKKLGMIACNTSENASPVEHFKKYLTWIYYASLHKDFHKKRSRSGLTL